MCKLCIVLGGDCVVVVTLFIVAPNVCVCYVLSWAVIVLLLLLLLHCLLLLPLCVCKLCFVLGGDCVVVVSMFITADIVCVGCVLSWTLIVLLLHCKLLLPLCV